MVTDGNQTYHGNHSTVHTNVKLLCCTPETNMICQLYQLYLNLKKKTVSLLKCEKENLR